MNAKNKFLVRDIFACVVELNLGKVEHLFLFLLQIEKLTVCSFFFFFVVIVALLMNIAQSRHRQSKNVQNFSSKCRSK